jgi:hypothetical protein
MNQQTHTALLMAAGRQDERANTAAGSEPFLTPGELEAIFKISTSHRLYLDKIGMPHISIGGKRRRYLRSQVEEFFLALARAAEQEASKE